MWAKQSAAATLIVGPILDSAGAEYASAVIGDLSISKNGGTLTALASAATLTYIANGQYTLVLTTGNTDTLGRAQILVNKSTYQMPPKDLMVVPAMIFDSMILGTDRLDVNATHIVDTALSVPGASGGLLISGSNAGTTTLGALTITGATVHTGNVSMAAGLTVTQSTSNGDAVILTGNGTGAGLKCAAGATGVGVSITSTAGDGLSITPTGGHGMVVTGNGTGKCGMVVTGATGANSHGLSVVAGSGHGISTTASASATHGIHASANVGSGINATGATAGLAATGTGTAPGALLTGVLTGAGLRCVGGAASGSTPAGAGVAFVGGAASVTSGGAAGVGWTVTGGAGAASTNGAAAGATIAGGGTNTVASAAHGLAVTGASTGSGLSAASGGGATGNGITAAAASTNGTGLALTGTGTGSGLSGTLAATTLASYFTVDSTKLYADAITGSVVKEIASNAAGGGGGGLDAAGVRAAIGLASANLDTQLSTIDDFLDTEIAAIKAQTDLIPASPASTTNITAGTITTVSGNVGGNVTGSVGSVATGGIVAASFAAGAINASAINTGAITAAKFAAGAIDAAALATDAGTEIAAAVWDLATSGHTTSGTFGAAMNAAGSAGDPWSTALPGAYGSGTAGFILGTNLNATVSSRMASYTQPTGFLAATFPADPAGLAGLASAHGAGSWATATGFSTLDAAGVRAAVGLGSANLDTQLDALPTNAELATALGTADDAVLAAIAALNNITVAAVAAQITTDHGAGSYVRNTEPLDAAGVRSAVGLATANLDTQLTGATAAAGTAFTTAMTESYAADGAAPTPAQALFLIQQVLTEHVITGTTWTVKKLDGTTQAAVLTLNDSVSPTGVTRTG